MKPLRPWKDGVSWAVRFLSCLIPRHRGRGSEVQNKSVNNVRKTKESFRKLLREVSQERIDKFSGIGLVLYDGRSKSNITHVDLRPSTKCPKGILIDGEKTKDFLLKISQNSHPWHDGYHFFDQKGQLTHVAQYFFPPIVPKVKPDESHGTRHLSAKYGSFIKGIIAIGIVESNHEAFYFEKGQEEKL